MAVLKDAVFVFVCMSKPTKKYQSEDTEWKASAVISKAAAKAWNKEFPKQKAKEVDNDDFENAYRIEPPFEDQDEQYVITLKLDTHYKDGEAVPEEYHPKVYAPNAQGKLKNITKTKLVGNGSVGALEYRVVENDYGRFAKLQNIRVDELIEYEQAGSTSLGEVEEDDTELAPKPKAEPKPKAKPKEETLGVEEEVEEEEVKEEPKAKPGRKPKAKPEPKADEEFHDDDIPW